MTSLWFLDCLVRELPTGDAPYAVLDMTAPAGSQPPPHIHHNEDEGFYVLEGGITLHTPDGPRPLGPGGFANAPRGVPHTYTAGGEGVRMLVISAPAGFAAFVNEMAVPAAVESLPVPAGPPDLERLAAVAARHGIEFVGAPGALPPVLQEV